MKKSEVIEKLKKGEIAIEMDSDKKKYIKMLNDILQKAFPKDKEYSEGCSNFYFKSQSNKNEWDYSNSNFFENCSVKITEILDEDNLANFKKLVSNEVSPALSEIMFKRGELVEVRFNNDDWQESYFIGISLKGIVVAEDFTGRISFFEYIRKIQPTIEQIKQLMKENNITKEDL